MDSLQAIEYVQAQRPIALPNLGALALACDTGAPIGAGEKEGEQKGRRPTLVTEADGLLKRSGCFGGCHLKQCDLHNVTYQRSTKPPRELTSSKLNGIDIQVLGELATLYSHYVGLIRLHTGPKSMLVF